MPLSQATRPIGTAAIAAWFSGLSALALPGAGFAQDTVSPRPEAAATEVIPAEAPRAAPSPEQNTPPNAPEVTPEQAVCALIEAAASSHGIPVGFFTRLLWKESNFRGDAVSPKGAQGIAQFMPYTAEERGLLDPFDPITAIPASASLLADLSNRFGNLGLAAAAYNAGAQRVSNWLADTKTGLPLETQDYVLSITGVPAETWAAPQDAAAAPASEKCLDLTALLKARGPAISPGIETARGPWGVQVAGFFSRERAISAYSGLQKQFPALLGGKPPMIITGRMRGRGARPFHKVRVPMQSRQEAEQFCAKLKAAGGICVVLKT